MGSLIHMVKQFLLAEINGTVLSTATSLDLKRPADRGRFSGTMLSSEFGCHWGHVLLSLHLDAPPWALCFRDARSTSKVEFPSPPQANPTAEELMTRLAIAEKHSLLLQLIRNSNTNERENTNQGSKNK
ncbi:hypothetical protein ACLOJK_031888 [Asimina triloba]